MGNQILSQPLVSFIIPYYNAGSTIQDTIDSVFNQTYSNFDIWIINDGSTDLFSIEKLKEFEGKPKIHILHQDNLGPSNARNNAVNLCEGDYVIPLDSDDLILSKGLVSAVSIMEKNKDIAVVFGDSILFNESDKRKNIPSINKLLIDNTIPFCSVIRKSIYIGVGGLDEWLSLKGLEDWEFWIRMLSLEYQFYHLKEDLFKIRVCKGSRTYKTANKNVEEIKKYVYEKHSDFLAKQYQELYYLNKQLLETPDYRIGNFLLRPYRWIKNIIKRK